MISKFSAHASQPAACSFKILTIEVSDGLESLLLSHDKSDSLLFTITHELAIADSALFPLFVPPSKKLDSELHEALEVLLS